MQEEEDTWPVVSELETMGRSIVLAGQRASPSGPQGPLNVLESTASADAALENAGDVRGVPQK